MKRINKLNAIQRTTSRGLVTTNHRGQRIYSPCQSRPSVLPDAQKFSTLHEWFLSRTEQHADKTALICGVTGKTLTYAQLAQRTQEIAAELFHGANVRRGDAVAIVSPNTLDFGCVYQAALKLGARVTTVNPTYSAEELRLQLDLSGATTIVTISMLEKLATGAAALPNSITKTVESIKILYTDRPLVHGGKAIPTSEQGFLQGKPHDTIVVPFSSGTTGLPKGVQLTNANLVTNIYQTSCANPIESHDITMAVLPYFHIYGMQVVMSMTLLGGGTQVVLPKFDLVQFLEKMQQYRATQLFVAPPMILGFVKHPATATVDRSSVRRVLSGAAPLHKEVQIMAEKLFPNSTVAQGYGLTETGPVATVAKPGVYGSAGMVVADTEMRIVSIDEAQLQVGGSAKSCGVDAPEGQEGEVWIRGPQVMKGYLRKEDTDKVMEDGWFRTGDIGRVDPATEHLIITDRLKELIKYKGYQVAPAELEGVIQTHPLVQDTVVVGIPDPLDTGCELPRAQIVLKPTATPEEIQSAEHTIAQYVEHHVAPYKKLRGGLRIVSSIPKSPAGKLLRRIAKAQETEYLKEHPLFPHANEQKRL